MCDKTNSYCSTGHADVVTATRVLKMTKKNDDGETSVSTRHAQTSGGLPRKTIELIEIALNAACISLHSEATCSSIRTALKAGATREEILIVLKMASVMSIGRDDLRAAILERCNRNSAADNASRR